MAQELIDYTVQKLEQKYPKLGPFNVFDVNNIFRVCISNNIGPNLLLASKYASLWLSSTRFLPSISGEDLCPEQQFVGYPHKEDRICRALENLCVGKYTTRKGAPLGSLQQAIQQACGPDLHSCFEQNCYYTGIVPCMRCWQVFYCSNDCRQRDWDSRHSETCSFLFPIPLSSCDNKKRKLTN